MLLVDGDGDGGAPSVPNGSSSARTPRSTGHATSATARWSSTRPTTSASWRCAAACPATLRAWSSPTTPGGCSACRAPTPRRQPVFQPELESADSQQRATLQAARLHDLVGRLASAPSPFWKERLAGVDPSQVRGLDALRDLPFTVKADLRTTYPWGLLAVPLEDTVRAHASSGTSGRPTVIAYTAGDIAVWDEVVARALACAGGRASDVLHVAYGYGLFTGGLGLHGGGERLGATVIPASGGNTSLQLQLLADLGASGLACTPSFAMLLAERAGRRRGRRPRAALPRLRGGALVGGLPRALGGGVDPDLWPPGGGARHLRAVGGDRPRRGDGVRRGPRCPARLRRPLPSRDRRPRERRAPARWPARRAGAHHPHQAGDAGAALPHRRRHDPLPAGPAPVVARTRGSPASRAAPTTC